MGEDVLADLEALGRIRRICCTFPDIEESSIQDRPLFRVGRRRLAICNGVTSPPRARRDGSGRSLHVLADPSEVQPLLQDDRFSRSPHHGDRGWLALRLDAAGVDWTEFRELLDAAHALVARTRP